MRLAFPFLLFLCLLLLGCTENKKEIKISDLGCKKDIKAEKISTEYSNGTVKINLKITYYCSEISFNSSYSINGSKIKIFYSKSAKPTKCICTHDIEILLSNLTKECYQIEIYDGKELVGETSIGTECPKSMPPEYRSAECFEDSDCATGGCSGEICTTREKASKIVTPCIWKDEYACLKLTSCGCENGTCRWKDSDAYQDCMRSVHR